jgi:hypothetical protein
VPLNFDWHLLIGDESALPAIARRLEELQSGVPAVVLTPGPVAIPRTCDRLMNLQVVLHRITIVPTLMLAFGSGAARAQAIESDIAPFNGLDVSNASISTLAIQRGGPPKDGIPAIDQPKSVRAARCDPHGVSVQLHEPTARRARRKGLARCPCRARQGIARSRVCALLAMLPCCPVRPNDPATAYRHSHRDFRGPRTSLATLCARHHTRSGHQATMIGTQTSTGPTPC